MPRFLESGVLSVLLAMAMPSCLHAKSQGNCWSKTELPAGAVELVSGKQAGKITVTFAADASVQPNPDGKAGFVLSAPATVTSGGAPDVYLQKDGSHFELGRVSLTMPVDTLVVSDGKVTAGKIGAGTTATIDIPSGSSVAAELKAPTKLVRSTSLSVDELRPAWLPSALPWGTIKAHAFKPGVNFREVKAKLAACLLVDGSWQYAAIQQIEPSDDSAALTIDLPESLGSWFSNPSLAVTLSDGTYAGVGHFLLVPTWVGAVAAILVLAIGHIVIWMLTIRQKKPDGAPSMFREGAVGRFSAAWFSAPNNVPSLAVFQIYLWTWVVITGLSYVMVLTGELFAITSQVLALLGIAGLGSIAARLVAPVTTGAMPNRIPRFSDILKNDDKLDPFKLQMFLFTIFAAGFVAARIAIDRAFPSLDANLLLLMGISNGIYVASKAAPGETLAAEVARLDRELTVLDEAKDNAEKEVERLKGVDTDLGEKKKQSPTDNTLDAKIADNKKLLEKATAAVADLKAKIDTATQARRAAMDKLAKGN